MSSDFKEVLIEAGVDNSLAVMSQRTCSVNSYCIEVSPFKDDILCTECGPNGRRIIYNNYIKILKHVYFNR